jgi:hypothetical protein
LGGSVSSTNVGGFPSTSESNRTGRL